jgi:hypothetical protein
MQIFKLFGPKRRISYLSGRQIFFMKLVEAVAEQKREGKCSAQFRQNGTAPMHRAMHCAVYAAMPSPAREARPDSRKSARSFEIRNIAVRCAT